MKKLLAVMILSLPLSSFASVVTFECKSEEVIGVHKFDAKGVVTIDEENKVSGSISVQVEKAQAPASAQVFEEIEIVGSRKHFDAGVMTKEAFDQLSVTSKDNYIKGLNLLLDFPVNIASQVFSVDNFLYRSNCKTVEVNQ